MAVTPGGRVGDATPFSTSTTSNWVARTGGLPDYIREVAHALVRRGVPESRAIATAITTMKRWAAGGGKVRPQVRAAAAKALAEFEAKAKTARTTSLAVEQPASAVHTQLVGDYPTPMLDWVKQARWQRRQVPLADIRMAHRPGKPHDAAKVAGIRQAIRDGKPMKPVVLVDDGSGKHVIADGYHRTRAHALEGRKTVHAVIATGLGRGPWNRQMHEHKLNLTWEDDVRTLELAESFLHHDWKHGWIPLTPAALAIKLHRAHGHAGDKSGREVHQALHSNLLYRLGVHHASEMQVSDAERAHLARAHEAKAVQHLREGNHHAALHEAGIGAGHRLQAGLLPATAKEDDALTRQKLAEARKFEHQNRLEDYRLARHAQVVAREGRTAGGRGELHLEKENGVKQPLTLKEFLKGSKRPDEEPVHPSRAPKNDLKAPEQGGVGATASQERMARALTNKELSGELKRNKPGTPAHDTALAEAKRRIAAAQANGVMSMRRGDKIAKAAAEPPKPAAPATSAEDARITIEHSGDGTTVHGTTRADAPHLKAAGFKWSRNLNAWYLPRTWTESTRRQRVNHLESRLKGAGESVHVQDAGFAKTTTAAERDAAKRTRAAARAERMTARAAKHAAESDAAYQRHRDVLERIPLGQPILVGHYSERGHRADLKRADQAMRRSILSGAKAKRAEQSAANAQRTAAGTSNPVVLGRKIDRLQTELRDVERRLHGHIPGAYPGEAPATVSGAYKARLEARQSELRDEIGHAQSQVAASGRKTFGSADVKPGDIVTVRGHPRKVTRVNGKTVSVETGYSWTDTVPYHEITDVRAPASAAPKPPTPVTGGAWEQLSSRIGNGFHSARKLDDGRMLSVFMTPNGKYVARVSGGHGKHHKVRGAFGTLAAAQQAAERDARSPVALSNDNDGKRVVDLAHVGFAKLEARIAARGNVKDPGAVAAAIGRAKYGAKGMAKKAAKGRRLAEHATKLRAHAKRHRTIAKQRLAAGDRAGARKSLARAQAIESMMRGAK